MGGDGDQHADDPIVPTKNTRLVAEGCRVMDRKLRNDLALYRPTAIDLFCGAGGLTLGLKQAHFRVVGAIDNNPLAVKTYRRNHPEVVVWPQDIREVRTEELALTLGLEIGELGLLAGCPPCQGFSALRTLNGSRRIEDSRNDLVFEFLRFVLGLRPRVVLMENVPGLSTDERIRRFRNAIESAGYHCTQEIVDAADYGVPQRRRRMILLAGLGGSIDPPAKTSVRPCVADKIAYLGPPGASGDPLHDILEQRSARVRELIAMIPKDGGSRTDLGEEYQLRCHRKTHGFHDVYGRMSWKGVAPTITGGCINPSKGRFLHPDQDRAITLREAALLQTFTPEYFFSLDRGKYAVAALIGNALPPELIRQHAEQIRKHLCAGM